MAEEAANATAKLPSVESSLGQCRCKFSGQKGSPDGNSKNSGRLSTARATLHKFSGRKRAPSHSSTMCQREHWSIGDHRVAFAPTVRYLYTVIPMRAKDAHFLAVIARSYVEKNYATILVRVRGPPGAYECVRVDLSLTNLRETLSDISTGAKLDSEIHLDPCPYPTFCVHVEHMQGDTPRTRVVRLTPRTASWRLAREGRRRVLDLFYGRFPTNLLILVSAVEHVYQARATLSLPRLDSGGPCFGPRPDDTSKIVAGNSFAAQSTPFCSPTIFPLAITDTLILRRCSMATAPDFALPDLSNPLHQPGDLQTLFGAVSALARSQDEGPTMFASEEALHVKAAKRALRARPLDIVLAAPPGIPFELYVHTTAGKAICVAFIALKFLHFSIPAKLDRQLWPFDDSIWPHLLRWADYLLPSGYISDIHLCKEARQHVLFRISTVIGITECLTSLPKEQVRSCLLGGSNDVLHTLVTLWVRWTDLVPALDMGPREVMWSACLLGSVWDSFEGQPAEDVLRTQIMRVAGGSARDVFRAGAAYLCALSAAGAVARERDEIGEQTTFVAAIIRPYDVGPETLPSSFIATLVTILDDNLTAAPDSHNLWVQIFMLLCTLCGHSDHATMLCIKHGLFPLLVRIRSICSHCSTGVVPYGSKQVSSGGATGILMTYIRNTFWSRRAVANFHTAYENYAARMPIVPLREDERAVLDVADRHYALLIEAEEQWSSVAKCCNYMRAHWSTGEHRYLCDVHFASRAGSTCPTVKSKDVYFLVVIARAFVESNYQQILARLNRQPSGNDLILVNLPLLHDPTVTELFTATACENSFRPDICPYPSISVQVSYQQTNGVRARLVNLVPRSAAWRYGKDEFATLTCTLYDPPTDWTCVD
uniref:Uncharacterized protein n=1 Tax=Schizophyllum commune (strain H4-8 / FGSC 9210) TaxID=578458 RepID=D8Q647_SCHCM